jgi:hypothetical protein
MAGGIAGGSRHPRGRRRSWAHRALVAAPAVLLAAALTLSFSEAAFAPRAALAVFPTIAETAPPATYTTITVPGYVVPSTGNVADTVARVASTAEIPDVALAAYERAAVVINATDKTCHLQWQVLAAIGRVESDHGQHAGSVLNAQGVAKPAILGPALDGRGGTTRVQDSDAGLLDGDQRFDRAVGPMQFIPSTWSVVGVDGDGDGRRDPQDIDDAALSAAVYLCVGKDDLSTPEGLQHAVYRYNHSQHYVDLVLSIADSYAAGDAWEVASGSGTFPTQPVDVRQSDPTRHPGAGHVPHPVAVPVEPADPTTPLDPVEPDGPLDPPPTDPPIDPPGPTPTPPPDPPTTPTDPPTTPGEPPTTPADPPTTPGDSTPTADPAVADTAAALCTELGYLDDPEDAADAYDACVEVALSAAPTDGGPLVLTHDELLALLAGAGVPAPPTLPAAPQ